MRVLIVDDSALMRRWLNECLASEPDIECAVARDGKDALAKIESFDPDVVTLDINMPVMDGLTCLSLIMEKAPRPVVMVSSLTEAGALATFEALELGAIDFIAKPGGTVSQNLRTIFPDLIAKVRAAAAAGRKIRRPALALAGASTARETEPARPRPRPSVVRPGLPRAGPRPPVAIWS
ncbi:Chemotaxis response regulator protein-glutamate methylesterase CheB [Rhodovulum sp. P5]|uniref:response regulator n=1 Tax=Rhodovulum sp. P5 TaxID=1564506 RepID=UPI0009C37F05|nr:response regulator [Rhodovulum sp. P5]ARE40332.1 Chemotaxis response regulator protein-glutamate methylesterase CheB [Rhodovulum sp. P5]